MNKFTEFVTTCPASQMIFQNMLHTETELVITKKEYDDLPVKVLRKSNTSNQKFMQK